MHRNVYDNFLLMGLKKCCQLCNARGKVSSFSLFLVNGRWAVSICVGLFIQIIISIILFITQIGIQILRCHTRNVFEGLVGAPFRRDPKICDIVTRLNVLNGAGGVATTFDSETSANLEDEELI